MTVKAGLISLREFLLVLLIAMIFSSPTLWLLGGIIKYASELSYSALFFLYFGLCFFEVMLIVILYFVIAGSSIKLIFKRLNILKQPCLSLVFDILLIFFSAALIVLNISGFHHGLVQLPMALLVTVFFSGHAFLNLLRIDKYFSKLELLVFSYVASFTLTGLVFFLLLPFGQSVRPIIVSAIFLSLGIFSAVRRSNLPNKIERKSFLKSIDMLLLLMVMLFHLILIISTYPGFSFLPGTDIINHYWQSRVLSRAPELYSQNTYLFFHLYEACLYSLSNAPLAFFQTSLALLILMLPLAFYIMAKEYFREVDSRLSSLSVVFWSMFSDFAFLYFIKLKLSFDVLTELEMLWMTSWKAGWMFCSLFKFWYIPLTVSFTTMFLLFFLLKRTDIPKIKYLTLFSMLIAVMYLTHVVEAVIFTSFLALYGIFSRNKSIRLDDALQSSLIGFIMVIIVYIVMQSTTIRFILNPSLTASILLPMIALTFSLAFRHIGLHTPRLNVKPGLSIAALTGLVLIYVLAFLIWFSFTNTFDLRQVAEWGVIPWFFYPVMLGIGGLLTLLTFMYVTKDKKLYSTLAPFIGFMIFTFIAGKVTSFVNVNFFNTNYYEFRFLDFIFAATSIMAPIPIVRIASRWDKPSLSKILKLSFLVGILVFWGISSSFLGLELRGGQTTGVYSYWSESMDTLNNVSHIFDEDPNSCLATLSDSSWTIAHFSAPTDLLPELEGRILRSSSGPEMPLYTLYRAPYFSHPYIFMYDWDRAYMQKYGDKYLAKHLIPMLPVIFKNRQITVYNVSKVAPPSPSSDTILVIPFEKSITNEMPYLFSYDILSQGLYDYTVAYELDDKVMRGKTLVFPFDFLPSHKKGFHNDFDLLETVQVDSSDYDEYMNYLKSGGRLIILNTLGFNGLAEDLLLVSNTTFTAKAIRGVNGSLELPAEVEVQNLVLNTDGVESLSYYVSASGECSPYAVKKTIGKGQLFYVNVYPIIKSMSGTDKQSFYYILGELLEVAGLNITKFQSNSLPAREATFRGASLNGEILIESTSMLYPLRMRGIVNITTIDRYLTFHNVTSLSLSNYEKITIITDKAEIGEGKGFYAILTLYGPVRLKPAGGTAILTFNSNGKIFSVNEPLEVLVHTNEPLIIHLRTPNINISGNTLLKEAYLSGLLLWRMRTYGQNLSIIGNTSFHIFLSDSHTYINNLKIDGSFSRDPPILGSIPLDAFFHKIQIQLGYLLWISYVFLNNHLLN